MLRKLVWAVALAPLAVGCSTDAGQSRDAEEAAQRLLGKPLPAVRPYELNGPDKVAGWKRDPALERDVDFTRLASGLPQPVRDRLTGVRAGYYGKPGSDRVIDRFFYVRGTLRDEDPAMVIKQVTTTIDGYGRPTVSASDAGDGLRKGVRAAYIDFGLGAFQNPFQVGGPPPTTYGSLVWTNGRTLHMLTMVNTGLTELLDKSKRVRD